MKTKFHHIVRAVMIKDKKLLVAEYIGHHYFLPGGHVEIGESAENALIRELREELGVNCSIQQFLGVIENQWQDKEVLHHEINHIFEVESQDLHTDLPPKSSESHLAFQWIDCNKEALNHYEIMPMPLVKELLERKLSDELLNCWISNF
ncbi:NUDIX domain-containing protein [Bacillus thuringiensis]|uniref:MutT/nudix family protein n=1 Tax=Bacillus cereus HuB4-4 TaxID=1053211 RepID=A0A9W5QUD9_BACCE|nr:MULTISPECIES: NUDIX domain-containing protein [Bacillus cereus group]MCU4817739.1 NUDIX domain-containing protein [Bacillus cereus]EOP88383.1 MutT/nudix family protein [Bacillus cereus HuB4-4]MCU4895629.1 NUDIX domain-containing protein [Bacillus cereus]MCU4984568.1 NUDIX domain-containing protein [Bacillus cereus]MCU5348226.1 NUDIX domain-containing protein [Bacillus cereus]